jgi:SOS response regulatory protein OraA/RecX
MKRLIRASIRNDITAASKSYIVKEKGAHKGIKAEIISEKMYEHLKKNLTHQCNDRKYRYYSKPGEQYSWTWYAVLKNNSEE